MLLETGGHRSTARVPRRSSRSSTSSARAAARPDRNDWENLDRLRPHDEVKFVIKDRADYEYARDVIARHDLAGRAAAIHLSPVHGVLDPRTLSEWVLADRLPVRVQLQLHKYIWDRPDDARCLIRPRARCRSMLLLSGGLDSYTAAAIARAEGFRLFALTVRYGQRHATELEAARAVAAALGVARHIELDVDLSRVRRLVADDGRAGAEGSAASIATEHPVDLRAGAQHGLPLARARLGRSARRARHLHRRQRARLLRISGLSPGIHRRLRAAGVAGDRAAACTASASASTRRCRS